ncbi:TetR/AcrR family transcriptional regulator [Butyrivibrio sp. MC2013]|uniref:TetR/AcrR family transcriptional regulator n=1 Tax=Butyrivibrio sp. MC2013 TaxID=1280686 RepID=UPI00041A724A|nr:TetR/AcrR family transcriptional regulator [Butyrivibrio sp. MC2013]
MYKGKNKTALSSLEKISTALYELLKTHPYSSISISSICEKAGLSRQTFYSLFDNKDEAACYLMGTTSNFLRSDLYQTRGDNSLWDICVSYAHFLITHKDPLHILFIDNKLAPLFYRSIRDVIINDPKTIILLRNTTDSQELADPELYASYWASCLSGFAATVYRNWDDSINEALLAKRFYFYLSGDFAKGRFKELQ